MEAFYEFDNVVRIHVTGSRIRQTVAEVAAWWHSTCQPSNHSYVANGDDYGLINLTQSNSLWMSEGNWLNATRLEWRPAVVFNQAGQVAMWFKGALPSLLGTGTEFSALSKVSNLPVLQAILTSWYPTAIAQWNIFSLTRHLIVNGKINPAFTDDHQINNFVGWGINAAGNLCTYFRDGWDIRPGYPAQGITKTQGAQKMIDNGVIHGGDGGYGGGLVVAIDGQVVNDWYNDGDAMHRNINHVCIESSVPIGGETPPIEPPPTEPPQTTKKIVSAKFIPTYDDGTEGPTQYLVSDPDHE